MQARERFCLANGTREFWTVDSKRGQVRVATANGEAQVYRAGQEISLAAFGGQRALPVADIFEN
jgi:ferric-dicitrate binding protein FerR (iron transport regulator)